MSQIVWDKIGEHYYETGTNHGVLYPQKNDGTYEKGVAWNGLTSIDDNPDGAEPNDFYADNIKYASIRSAETLKYTINAYTHPDEFYECDGSAQAASGVFLHQQPRKAFGFCYRSEIGNDTPSTEDDAYKLHIYYNSVASPSDRSYETINDNPDAIELSWECDATPVNVTGHKPVCSITIDSRTADKTKLAALEKILYGDESAEPRLPLPDEIITLMAA